MSKYITDISDYHKLTLKERVEEALDYVKQSFSINDEYEVLELGHIVKGYSYDHETYNFCEMISLEVRIRYRYDFMTSFTSSIALFPIYIGSDYSDGPLVFFDTHTKFGHHRYCDGVGNHFDVEDYLVPDPLVDIVDLSKYKQLL